MAWDNANIIFPDGEVVLPDEQVISIPELQNSEIKTLYYLRSYEARDMVWKQTMTVYGKDGEYTVLDTYNVNSITPHPVDEPVLNVYGQKMLQDYIVLNDIDTSTLIPEPTIDATTIITNMSTYS